MRPILFTVWGRPVRSYPALLYVGIVLGIDAQLVAAHARGLDETRSLAATLVLLVAGLAGARLLHVALHWREYRDRPIEALRCSRGGASMFGGLIAMLVGSPFLLDRLGLPFARYWDGTAFTLVVGLIAGRVGCLLQGCCAGRPTSAWLGLSLTDHRGVRTRRVPTPLLEAAWGVVVLAGAIVVFDARLFAGAVLLWVVGAYAAGRAVLETTREVEERVAGIRAQRVIAVALVGGCAVAWRLAP